MTASDPCAHSDEMMKPYMDRVLTDAERAEAEEHLDGCAYCRKRYRFEEALRRFVKHVGDGEPMTVELKTKLADLRTPLQ
jgi:anti-sigma factor RsiW